ncbi:MAG: extracellular solute-binding protein [Candidatus Spechtbacteria bacterium]|nr:extracellular solute-binding protein [Candidatus Spechtbacteria bacterium]
MEPYQRNQLIIGAVVILTIALGAGLWFCFIPGLSKCVAPPVQQEVVNLDFWNVFEDSDVYASLIAKFNQQYPNISVAYRKKEYDTYRADLKQAFMQGNGPDIFAIHNTWLPLEQKNIEPAPSSQLSFDDFQNRYPDVVRYDFAAQTGANQISPPRVYAIPLFVDTLALYYNRTYFHNNTLIDPPKTWDDFVTYVKKLTKYNASGNVDLAGVVMGTGKNINRSTDILAMLMLQTGTRMTDDAQTKPTFADPVYDAQGKRFDPGLQALEFYTSFADKKSEVYSWSPDMHYSVDAFVAGDAAMMINYSYMIPTIQQKNRYLDFAVAPIPQPSDQRQKAAFANYWGLTVSKNSKHSDAAWQFILFLAREENEKEYLTKVQRPTALKSLIAWQDKNASDLLKPFVDQTLIARSWYMGDNVSTENALITMIDSVASGATAPADALGKAQNDISAIFQKVRRGVVQ